MVEVFCPARLLASGMCLVDTPGLGSVFQGNTDEIRAFIPHIDAALVVLGADPPISGEELELVVSVAAQVRDLVFVLNKSDRLAGNELAEAQRFTHNVLSARLHDARQRLLEVSATECIERGPTRDWPAFEQRLRQLATGTTDVVSQRHVEGWHV